MADEEDEEEVVDVEGAGANRELLLSQGTKQVALVGAGLELMVH